MRSQVIHWLSVTGDAIEIVGVGAGKNFLPSHVKRKTSHLAQIEVKVHRSLELDLVDDFLNSL